MELKNQTNYKGNASKLFNILNEVEIWTIKSVI